jgi:hypothetical protein
MLVLLLYDYTYGMAGGYGYGSRFGVRTEYIPDIEHLIIIIGLIFWFPEIHIVWMAQLT